MSNDAKLLNEKLDKYTKILEPVLKEHLEQVDGKRKEEEEEKKRLAQERQEQEQLAREYEKQSLMAKEQEGRYLGKKEKKKSSVSFTILMISFTVLILAFLFWNFKGRV